MIYDKEKSFLDNIIEAEDKNVALIFKNFVDSRFIPSWDELLNCIYNECEKESKNKINEDLETLIGNVIFRQPLFMTTNLDQNSSEKYFPKIYNFINEVANNHDIQLTFVGPKISIGPFTVGSHVDNWPGFSLQAQGKTRWTFSDARLGSLEEKYVEVFDAEQGDLLFFPKGLFHEVKVNSPRASMQFNVADKIHSDM